MFETPHGQGYERTHINALSGQLACRQMTPVQKGSRMKYEGGAMKKAGNSDSPVQ
jgi:hypothetical protein